MSIAAGCQPNLRIPIAPDDQIAFRAQALDELKKAASSSDPFLRMQAIEAFQEVLPDEGVQYIESNLDTGDVPITFAALMALGTLQRAEFLDRYRTRAEDPNPNVRIAAIFAMHRCGDRSRTSELADYLMSNPEPRVRANAAMAVGRLGEASSIELLRTALKREASSRGRNKLNVQLNIYEALALLGDPQGIGSLLTYGYSVVPPQAMLGLTMLASAATPEAEELFLDRLSRADNPEIRLQAARGLGRVGYRGYEYENILDMAIAHLFFRTPRAGDPVDPPEQQITRTRALAALTLEAFGDPEALGALREAFVRNADRPFVRVATARAAIAIMDGIRGRPEPASRPANPGPLPALSKAAPPA